MKLTIGMCTYDDFDGVYFTVQSLRLYHKKKYKILVVDNNPCSNYGKATKIFCDSIDCDYVPFDKKTGTSVRNEIFKNSKTEYTLCVDCHVLLHPNSLDSLLEFYKKNPDTKNILSGPLCDDNFNVSATHMNCEWRQLMYGTWSFDERVNKLDPFEIHMMGLGLFSCKTKNWPNFNEDFIGFGGEEGYIHEKFRKLGGKSICIPQLKWTHRFGRPGGTRYINDVKDRIWNYFIGWLELTKDPNHHMINSIIKHFKSTEVEEYINDSSLVDKIFLEAKKHYNI